MTRTFRAEREALRPPRRLRRLFLTTVASAVIALGLAGSAQAAITPVDETPAGATTVAEAIRTPSFNLIGALWQTAPPLNNPAYAGVLRQPVVDRVHAGSAADLEHFAVES
jgi:hypothetical protein